MRQPKSTKGSRSWQSRYHEAAEKRSLFAAFRQLGRTQDKERNEREKKISPAGRRPTSAALRQVLTRSAEHWHVAARGFCRDCKRISDRKFPNLFGAAKNSIRNHARSRKNFGSVFSGGSLGRKRVLRQSRYHEAAKEYEGQQVLAKPLP